MSGIPNRVSNDFSSGVFYDRHGYFYACFMGGILTFKQSSCLNKIKRVFCLQFNIYTISTFFFAPQAGYQDAPGLQAQET